MVSKVRSAVTKEAFHRLDEEARWVEVVDGKRAAIDQPRYVPLPNYTLSTICPSCGADTYRLACKVRCGRCGFMWDCSEL